MLDHTVSSFVSVTPLESFKKTTGQFPASLWRQKCILQGLGLSTAVFVVTTPGILSQNAIGFPTLT